MHTHLFHSNRQHVDSQHTSTTLHASPSLYLSLALSLCHPRTHTLPHTRTYTHSHSHPHPRIYTQVLDKALREDLGFDHLLWVFSGRRGIHCWVADERARNLTDAGRTAVAEYLNIFKGGDKDKTKLDAIRTPLHPALHRAYEEVLFPAFGELMEDQGWLDEDSMERTLDLVNDAEIKARLVEKWRKRKNSSQEDRWGDLNAAIEKKFKDQKYLAAETVKFIVFKLTYPRLDIAVSKMMNHLLKSPFCVRESPPTPHTHTQTYPIGSYDSGVSLSSRQ